MSDIFSLISELKSKGESCVLVTVISKDGMAPCDVGKKMVVLENNKTIGTIGGGSIEHFASKRAKDIFLTHESITENYVLNDGKILPNEGEVKLNMACGGKATLFYEFVGPKQWVYIFGAGHCGAKLASILNSLDFYVYLIDDRQDILDNVKIDGICKINSSFADFFEKYEVQKNRYFVVATPSHIHDFEVLDKIVEKDIKPAYFGMLCSKKKVVDYLTKLHEKYGSKIDLKNFYSPIGLDLGGDSPSEIAISISSEMLSIYYKKDKNISHMREKIDKDKRYF